MPESIVYRQPFPGPGLGIRVIGEVTNEKLKILRRADKILRDEIENENAGWGCHNDIKSIRDMLSRIIEEKNLICEKGKNAYRLSEKYVWENIAKRSHLEYEKIIRSEKC